MIFGFNLVSLVEGVVFAHVGLERERKEGTLRTILVSFYLPDGLIWTRNRREKKKGNEGGKKNRKNEKRIERKKGKGNRYGRR